MADWFDTLKGKASSAWDEAVSTGEEYLGQVWETKKESILSADEQAVQTVAAIPGAQDASSQGQGVSTAKAGFNWQAAGVLVGVAGILMKVMK